MKRVSLILLGVALGASVVLADGTNALPTLTLADAQKVALQNHPSSRRRIPVRLPRKRSSRKLVPGISRRPMPMPLPPGRVPITPDMAGGLNNPRVYDRAAGGLAVSQLITDFGHTANLTASSKFQAQAESQNANATREQVLLQADTSYFEGLEAQAVLHVARQTFDTRQLLLDQVTALATNKLRSELDVSFAQVALEQGRLLLQKAQNDADAAMASLSTALGYHEFHQFQLVEQSLPMNAVTNDVSSLIQMALARRPELSNTVPNQ